VHKPILFFDGVCSLCNGFIDFLFRWDEKEQFTVASLQGNTAQEKLPVEYTRDLDTFVLYIDGEIYVRSTAVLMVIKKLPFPWNFLGYIGMIFPKVIRDFVYKRIANNRYLMFGKKDSCRLPTPEERARFLG
tara:strand:+ start:210632 stop:211027 length:396 start_codon:yes stop_codon:yes gene_type:complete